EVEVVNAALELVLVDPDLPGLAEVVDVLGEPDLVDPPLGRGLEVRPERRRRVVDLLGLAHRPATEVHVVVDDHGPGLSGHPCGKGARHLPGPCLAPAPAGTATAAFTKARRRASSRRAPGRPMWSPSATGGRPGRP